MADSNVNAYTERTEVIFLGSGTSGGVPDLGCLIDSDRKCKTCWDAIQPGSRNRRQNTSLVIKTTFTSVCFIIPIGHD
jgi:phosphoribosyl 1,2-cyclic phosphodiesterase